LTRGAWPSEEGLDGIQNKIDPGPAMEKDLYDPPPKELKKIPTVCGSLREALSSLDRDRAFLKAGDGFEMTPHPVEIRTAWHASEQATSTATASRTSFFKRRAAVRPRSGK
jgi:glutamine synthetase